MNSTRVPTFSPERSVDERRSERAGPAGRRTTPEAAGGKAVDPLAFPEMRVLLCAARRRLEADDVVRMRALLEGPIDWSRLRRLALRHKLLPLLAAHLADFADLVPADVGGQFARDRRVSASASLRHLGELLGLLTFLRDHRIDAVPYKGPVLAAELYGDAALRPVGDLDFLVRRGDAPRVRELLMARGYRPSHELDAGAEEFMFQSRYGETFVHDRAVPVELHWAFTNGDIALSLDYESVAPRLVTIAVGRNAVRVFGREDLLVILSVHGAKHRWDRLEWLCGLAEAVRSAPRGLDWDGVVAQATRLGVRRMLLLGLMLAHDLLNAPVPAAVLVHCRRDAAVGDAARQVPHFLAAERAAPESHNVAIDLFRLGLRERWRDRVRFTLYRLTTPSRPEQWSALRMGRYAIPLHAVARPLRVARKLLLPSHTKTDGGPRPD